ncbi:MAG: T9SS type A sorting domain-containing protein [Bacteroides nordii]
MKKITLFSMLISLAFANTTFAQENVDVTPSKFVFANQEVGPFVYDGVAEAQYTTNATAKNPVYKSDAGGYTYLMGWGKFNIKDGVDQGNTPYMRTMSNIIDLGGEVGKVLCFKGHACTDEVFKYGIKPDASQLVGDIEWPAMALFLGSKINGTEYQNKEYKARLSITWRICLPADEYSDDSKAFAIRMNDYSINTKPFSSGDELIALTYETEDADTWCTQEDDFTFNGDAEQVPLLIKFSFDKYVTTSALLIKEIKVTINPTGEPKLVEHKTLKMNPVISAIENQAISSYNYTITGNNLCINNLSGEKITVYSTSGALITSFTATQSTENILLTGNGVFIVQVGNENFKIIK